MDNRDENGRITIICKLHGKFQQNPHDHLQGSGCPFCKSSQMENSVRKLLLDNNVKFEEQKRFEWLGYRSLDFYLPQHNIAIECQGIQHFKPIEQFGGKSAFKKQIKNDSEKHKLCKENNATILYYSDLNMDYSYDVIKIKQSWQKQ